MALVRDQLRRDLTGAIKRGDRTAVAALRQALSAIENHEAPPRRDDPADAGGASNGSHHFAASRVGLGAGEVDRRSLTDADVLAIVRTMVDELQSAMRAYGRLGRHDLAGGLQAQIAVLRHYLD